MDDLLKEAIADAKAVRETALANAKIALEEAFTPRLTSMLSQKIQHEVEGDEVEDAEEAYDEDEEAPVEPEVEAPAEEEEPVAHDEEEEEEAEEAPEEMMDAEEGEEDSVAHDEEEDDVVEINGVKYAPVVSEEEDEEEVEEGEQEDAEEADELDLEAILRELEDAEEDEEEPVAEGEEEEEVEESVTEGEEEEEVDESKEVKEEKDEDEVDEDVDLEEVLKALSEEEEGEEEVEEVAKLQTELKEHRDVVKFLRAKLNEVNLLNAKLLFSNKLFRTFGLTNEQKMKVVETFDRTKNLREIKLVYSTLAESFGQVKASPIKESVRKGSSSKAVASTKPKKQVISEGDDLKARFKKLANII